MRVCVCVCESLCMCNVYVRICTYGYMCMCLSNLCQNIACSLVLSGGMYVICALAWACISVLAGRKPPTAHLYNPQEHECKADNWWQCHRSSKKTGWSQLAAEEQTVSTLDVDDKSQMQLQGSYHILSLLWHVVTIIVTILLRILWFGMSVETSQLVATQRPPAYTRMWCDAMITSQIGGKEALSSWHWRY